MGGGHSAAKKDCAARRIGLNLGNVFVKKSCHTMFCRSYHSRPLTPGERTLAQSVFGDRLRLDDIRLKTAWWVLKGYAVSPNGNVYFHPHDFRDDFSQENVPIRAWLIHELTHVWQVQQGIAVLRRALLNRRYRYELQSDKPFLAYGVEQQARMVEDLYKQRATGRLNAQLLAVVPFGQTIAKYTQNDTYLA